MPSADITSLVGEGVMKKGGGDGSHPRKVFVSIVLSIFGDLDTQSVRRISSDEHQKHFCERKKGLKGAKNFLGNIFPKS